MFVPVESPLVTTMPNSNVAGPYGRQADGSKEVLPRSESAAINPRAIWGAAGSQRKQGMAWNGHQLPFFCISLHINFNETTWNNMKQHVSQHFSQHETTTTVITAYYCKDPQRSFMDLWKHDGKKVPSPGGGWLWAGASSASDCGLLRCETFGVWKFPDCRGFCTTYCLNISKWWFLTNYLQSYNILFHTISSI